MAANRQYKNSVFSFLFSDPAALRELYGALEGIELPPDLPITINTLEGVLFRDRLNDISFVVGGSIVVLIEHQSTINPNMALRLLMYIARVYEKITAGKNIYSIKKLVVPRPVFIVLYNGTDPYPDEAVLKLSDAFASAASLGLHAPPELELAVKVYNINQGHNEAIVRHCDNLDGYSAFIAKAREFSAELSGGRKPMKLTEDELAEAIKKAVTWCIAHNKLKHFLESHSSEVTNMLMTEWNMEDALAVRDREAREEGREEGREEMNIAIAKNALGEGLSLEIIQKITGLKIEDIEQLAEE
jgi:predicted transposase/invertase (TIGR01784 family)